MTQTNKKRLPSLIVVFLAAFTLAALPSISSPSEAHAAPKSKRAKSKSKSKTSKSASGSSQKYPIHHKSVEGETLGEIAMKYDASVHDLKEWNNLDGYEIEPNVDLIVKKTGTPTVQSARRTIMISHKIRPGDTFARIAKKYRVSVSNLRKWNRGVNPRRLQLGKSVRISRPTSVKTSSSWGTPNKGRLYNGVPLKSSEIIRARSRTLGFGTQRTINLIEAGAAHVKEEFPDSASLLVGDISRQNGGRFKPHLSHQSGRDADITYYYKGDVELDRLHKMSQDTFDVVKTWELFKSWIDADKVTYIFVDYRLQKMLYQYLRHEGYSDEELARILEYPRPPGRKVRPIIVHSPGHLDHFHVRMKCGPLDIRCH